MAVKPIDKIVEGLKSLTEGYSQLKSQLADKLEIDYSDIDEIKDPELSQNLYTEIRNVLENFLESEEVSSTLLGSLFSDLYEGLLEIDPQAIEEDYEDEDEDDDYYYEDDYDEEEEEE
ncbi:MAG: hypothetical protein NZT61_01590 [Deltaproteobacteria bacterium]|nr:hypothetical protein [Deltaproteobacteria bacterium]